MDAEIKENLKDIALMLCLVLLAFCLFLLIGGS